MTSPDIAQLAAQDVSFTYGPRQILAAIYLAVHAGQLVGLLGPNGSGKSTLLKILAGLLPTPGAVSYAGRSLHAMTPRARSRFRAYVPQQTPTTFAYRVHEIVAMGLAHQHPLYHAPVGHAAVQRALAAVQFAPSPDAPFDTLSGGERQQVRVAQALVAQPPLLLLDEPLAALDLRHRAAIMATLRQRARAGAAVVLSLHDINLAALSCDVLWLLEAGCLAASGPPSTVLQAERVSRIYQTRVLLGQHPTRLTPTVELDPQPWEL